MKTFTFLLSLLAVTLLVEPAQAQTKTTKPAVAKPAASAAKPAAAAAKPAAPAKPAVTAAKPAAEPVLASAAAAEPPALVTDKMEPAAPNTDVLKVKVETNPVTKRLTVRTNSANPTRVEINDADGRPVITRDLIVGTDAAVLDVSRLPAGAYLVQCTSGERRGLKRVMLGQ